MVAIAMYVTCIRSIVALPAYDGVLVWLASRPVLSNAAAQSAGCQPPTCQDR